VTKKTCLENYKLHPLSQKKIAKKKINPYFKPSKDACMSFNPKALHNI